MLSSNLRKLFGLSRARPTHKAQLGAAAFCIALVLRLRMDISLSHWFSPLPILMARRTHCLQRIGYRVSCDYTQVSLSSMRVIAPALPRAGQWIAFIAPAAAIVAPLHLPLAHLSRTDYVPEIPCMRLSKGEKELSFYYS